MVLGARTIGHRSLGDSAPAGAGVLDPVAAGSSGSGALTFGALTVTGDGHLTRNGAGTFVFGALRLGSAGSPTGGAGGEVTVRNFRDVTFPFEFPIRYADHYQALGMSAEHAEWMELRDRELERYIAESMPDLTFSLPGPLTETTSPRFRSRMHYRVDQWIASLNTAGSSTTSLWVLRSGVRTVQIELGAGVNEVEVSRYVLLDKGVDYVQIEIETAGAGAADLTVQGQMRH